MQQLIKYASSSISVESLQIKLALILSQSTISHNKKLLDALPGLVPSKSNLQFTDFLRVRDHVMKDAHFVYHLFSEPARVNQVNQQLFQNLDPPVLASLDNLLKLHRYYVLFGNEEICTKLDALIQRALSASMQKFSLIEYLHQSILMPYGYTKNQGMTDLLKKLSYFLKAKDYYTYTINYGVMLNQIIEHYGLETDNMENIETIALSDHPYSLFYEIKQKLGTHHKSGEIKIAQKIGAHLYNMTMGNGIYFDILKSGRNAEKNLFNVRYQLIKIMAALQKSKAQNRIFCLLQNICEPDDVAQNVISKLVLADH